VLVFSSSVVLAVVAGAAALVGVVVAWAVRRLLRADEEERRLEAARDLEEAGLLDERLRDFLAERRRRGER
jgi:hypothetical protein